MGNITLFAQIISKLDRSKFNKNVKGKQTDKHYKGFTSWIHLVSMLFCQFAKSQSVRDISNCLRSATGNLNHLGINRALSKSSISYQNNHRDQGVAQFNSKQLEDITTYQNHRNKYNVEVTTNALDTINLVNEPEIVYHSKNNKATKSSVDKYVAGNKDKYAIKVAYIFRDITKFLMTNAGITSITVGLFY